MTVAGSRQGRGIAVAAAVTAVARSAAGPGRLFVADQRPSPAVGRWQRVNHRGEPVSLLEGPAVAAGLLLGGLAAAGSPRAAAAIAVATTGGAAFGIIDDLTEDTTTRERGLRGHLGALARGRLTTGGLKVLGIGGAALAAAAIATPPGGGRAARAVDVAASGALIAVSANLINLLDLRPGRALKAAALLAAPIAAGGGAGAGAAASVLGAAAAALPGDLAERDMLGDGGANAVGALLGTSVVLGAGLPVRLVALGAGVALTLASEWISFSAVIEATPVLRAVDRWGRRRGAATGAGTAASRSGASAAGSAGVSAARSSDPGLDG